MCATVVLSEMSSVGPEAKIVAPSVSSCSPIGVANASGRSTAPVLHLFQSFSLKMKAGSLTTL